MDLILISLNKVRTFNCAGLNNESLQVRSRSHSRKLVLTKMYSVYHNE
jgi:hypothetical protein